MSFQPFKIGKYLLLDRLATGGMAEVYQAKASGAGGFEKFLAIKRILPNYSSNEEFVRMFEFEAKLSSQLTHSNIVQVYDFVKSGDTYLLAMEYVAGKNLRQLVNKAKKVNLVPPVELSVYLLNEVCKGLEYAHQKKNDITGQQLHIIHRDMSPQNIMISYEGAVKIVDFGIAKAKDRVDETRSGVIKGKFSYMSPEQANGESVDHRSDIFSTGIILYELLTGKRLFSADNDLATLKMIQECNIPKPSTINPKIQVELERILLRLLTKDLSQRYQSAGLCHRHLQEYLSRFYPKYTQRDVGDFVQKVFQQEIEAEKKRLEHSLKQTIPFSQGKSESAFGDSALEEISDVMEESITRSDQSEITEITSEEEQRQVLASEVFDLDENVSGIKSKEYREKTIVEPIIPEEKSISTVGGSSPSGEKIFKEKAPEKVSVVSVAPPPPDPTPTPVFDQSRAQESSSQSLREESQVREPSYEPPTEVKTAQTSLPERPETSISHVSIHPSVSDTSRRREGSLSGSTEVDNSEGSQFSISQWQSPNIEKPSDYRSDQWRGRVSPGSNRPTVTARLIPLVGILAFGFLAFGLFRVYQSGSVPVVVKPFIEHSPANVPTTSPPIAPPAEPTEVSDCVLRLETNPNGADVIIDGKIRGKTLTVAAVPCQKNVNIKLMLDGYETVPINYFVEEREGRLFKHLTKIPTGTVELTVNRNVALYINGYAMGELMAGKTRAIPVRAGRVHKFRFENKIMGIDLTQEYPITEGAVLRKTLFLEEIATSPTKNKSKKR